MSHVRTVRSNQRSTLPKPQNLERHQQVNVGKHSDGIKLYIRMLSRYRVTPNMYSGFHLGRYLTP